MFGNSYWTSVNLRMSLLCFLTLVSCGSGYVEDDDVQGPIPDGRYTAKIKPLNKNFGKFHGWMNITISDNQFWARVKIDGPQTAHMHSQYIHTNSKCPDAESDLNQDGIIDFMEIYNDAGPILLPLDANLNAQMKGLNEFPVMKKRNKFYYYSEASNSDRLMRDLRLKDIYTSDMMTKLKPSEELDLTRRIIIIYGISAEQYVPASVSTFEGYPKQTAMPIACGEIVEGDYEVTH